MLQIIIANQDQHANLIRELFWEYLQWDNVKVEENFHVSFDIAAMLEEERNRMIAQVEALTCCKHNKHMRHVKPRKQGGKTATEGSHASVREKRQRQATRLLFVQKVQERS